jgi:hypothetical protein
MNPGTNLPDNFRLNKWYLDYTGQNGEAMIFYAAKLTWYGFSATYTSWLHYHPESGVKLKSRFSHVQIPQLKDNLITWNDKKFGISGTWESSEQMIRSRLYDSEEGHLDWECYQPASKVQLKIGERCLDGEGYAEQLFLTVPPWKIPMDELRWGRFVSPGNNMVWIELKEKEKQQWLWFNGEKMEKCIIDDYQIILPEKNLILNLDQGVTLESEKKISSVSNRIVRYIPGFKRFIPLGFLMAEEIKWLSKGKIRTDDRILAGGMAIHELVNFKSR